MKKKYNIDAEILDSWCNSNENKIYFIIKANEKIMLVTRGLFRDVEESNNNS